MKSMVLSLLILASCAMLKNVPPIGVGINLPEFGPQSTEPIFTDLFKLSLPFYPQVSSDGGSTWRWANPTLLDRSIDGYPQSLPSGSLYSAVAEIGYADGPAKGKLYSSGTYILLYDGAGTISAEGDATVQSEDKAAKRMVLSVNPRNSIKIRIKETSSTNPIRNIRVVPAEYESTYNTTDIFHPKFIERIKTFRVLRFCGWQREYFRTSLVNQRSWSNRTLMINQTQNNEKMGIALEYMILLSNRLNASAWFCLPAYCDDDYIKNFAQTLKDGLNTTQKTFIEYSSNVGLEEVMANRTNRMADLFTEVYGEERRKSDLIVVAPSKNWHYFPHLVTYFQSNFSKVDAICLDGSFGMELGYNHNYLNLSSVESLTKGDVIKLAKSSVLHAQRMQNMNIQLIRVHGLSVITFTGGPSFHVSLYGYRSRLAKLQRENPGAKDEELEKDAQREAAFAQVLIEVNRDPEMKEIYMDLLRRWFVIGGLTYVGSDLERVPNIEFEGYPALMEDVSLPLERNPKYHGIIAFIAGNVSKLPYTSADVRSPSPPVCDPECKWGTCYQNKCVCFEGYSGEACTVSGARPNSCTANVGVNLAGIKDWSSEWSFVDLWKMSREWVTQEFTSYIWDTGKLSNLTIRNDGYPATLPDNTIVAGLMTRDLKGHYETGTYVVLYDGDGILSFGLQCVKNIRRSVGRVELDVEPTTEMNNGILIQIEWTNPADPIHNIRVIRPGHEATYKAFPFHPLFLHHLERFSALRFMDWLSTNSQIDTKWQYRVTTQNRTYTINGAPLETMILLANTLGTDMWLNVPHLADDNYIEEMAKLVNSTLRPDVKIIVEYSNEVWGTLFPGGIHAQQEGLRMNLSADGGQARFCYLGLRTQNISTIWRKVFGAEGSANRNRLQIVLAAQAVNPDTSKRILECLDSYKYVDALAIAPYFNGNLTKANSGKDEDIVTLNQLLTFNILPSINQRITRLKEHIEIAKAKGLKTFLYEAGQGLVGPTTKQNELAIEANRDSRMKGLYEAYLRKVKEAGTDLIMHFSSISKYGRSGSWGLMEFIDEDVNKAPKWSALQEFIVSSGKCTQFPIYTGCPNECGGNEFGICLKSGKCSCFYGRQGLDCNPVKYVDFYDCGYKCTFDQGECKQYLVSGPNRYHKCYCHSGYSGTHCGIPICSKDCNYKGQCVGPEQCSCYEGFTGSQCEIDCGCNGHGKCDPKDSSKCICDSGFYFNTVEKRCVFACNCKNTNQYCIGPNECSCLKSCINGICVNEKCECFGGFSGETCELATERPNSGTKVGINLGGVNDYSTQQAFLDLFKASRPWISQYVHGTQPSDIVYTWDTKVYQYLDTLGNPTLLSSGNALGTLMVRDLHKHYEGGDYVVLYEGDGILNIGMDAVVKKVRKGRIELEVTPQTVRDNGIYLQITKIDPSNPLKNIRVVKRENEYLHDRLIFHPKFKTLISMFEGIRFMDWARTNKNTDTKWNERTTMKHARQSMENGVALEYMVKLSNMLGSDPWFCIPHRADDDYVKKYAQYVKANLRPDLKIYVEYSNEVWNNFFIQGQYATAEGKKSGLSNQEFYAKRSVEIFSVFKSVFGATNRTRLIFILSTQAVSTWVSKKILTYSDSYRNADALGVGFYFDCNGIGSKTNAVKVPIMTVEEILEKCEAAIEDSVASVEQQIALARTYNLPIILYEAGTAISEHNTIYTGQEVSGATEKYIAVNRHPKMKEIYYKVLQRLKEIGALDKFPLFHFSSIGLPSKYGSWGAIEYFDQPSKEAPKYAALLKFMTSNTGKLYGRIGCKDTTALNFDASAEINRGCRFAPKKIDSAGGIIKTEKLEVAIPGQALSNETSIEVREAEIKNNRTIGVQFVLGPSGTVFKVPIRICINISEVYNAVSNMTLRLFVSYDDNDNHWALTNNTFQVGYLICGNISHFSSVAVMEANLTTTGSTTSRGSHLFVWVALLVLLIMLLG